MDLRIYKNKQEVAEEFSAYFVEKAGTGNAFHVALSGGSTPKIVFDVLAERFSDKLDWNKVHFYWGDERCVPPTDDESNYKMTVEHLFSKIVVPKANIHRIRGEEEPNTEAICYSNLLEINLDSVEGTPQFDLIILGMGDDGHTASIFPHQINLWNAEDHCVVATHPESGQQRVSINGKVINTAKEVAFLVTGASKAEKVKAVVEKTEGSKEYPATLVDPKSGNLVWFLDKDAAADLS